MGPEGLPPPDGPEPPEPAPKDIVYSSIRVRSPRARAGSFLGTGWSFPPQFGAAGASVAMASGADDIHQSLQILLGTQLGERVLHEGFGCDLNGALFEEIDQGLMNRLDSMISDAILYHEPRITLSSVDVSRDPAEPGLLVIRLDYTVMETNSRYNMVYPFYLDEAVTPGL